MKPQPLQLNTADGEKIELWSYPNLNAFKSPVLLVHGIGSNAAMWEPTFLAENIVNFLGARGFPLYSLNLRRSQDNWDLCDYIDYDIPEAINFLQKTHGSEVHWIGHSMGGLLGYMYQVKYPQNIVKSITTLGSPGLRASRSQGLALQMVKPLVRAAAMRMATCRLDKVPQKLADTLLGLSLIYGNPSRPWQTMQEVLGGEQDFYGDISFSEAFQLLTLFEKQGLRSLRQNFSYGAFSESIKKPVFALAGNRDLIAPPTLVEQGLADIGSPVKKFHVLSPKTGAQSSYGHHDLLMGSTTHLDVWPQIYDWLCSHENENH